MGTCSPEINSSPTLSCKTAMFLWKCDYVIAQDGIDHFAWTVKPGIAASPTPSSTCLSTLWLVDIEVRRECTQQYERSHVGALQRYKHSGGSVTRYSACTHLSASKQSGRKSHLQKWTANQHWSRTLPLHPACKMATRHRKQLQGTTAKACWFDILHLLPERSSHERKKS